MMIRTASILSIIIYLGVAFNLSATSQPTGDKKEAVNKQHTVIVEQTGRTVASDHTHPYDFTIELPDDIFDKNEVNAISVAINNFTLNFANQQKDGQQADALG